MLAVSPSIESVIHGELRSHIDTVFKYIRLENIQELTDADVIHDYNLSQTSFLHPVNSTRRISKNSTTAQELEEVKA